MRRKVRFLFSSAVILFALVLAPATAQAQWHGGHGPGVRVYVGASWGYPYWGWGYPYWGWGYPYWGWAPYWYGYPYYTGHPDNSAEVRLEVTPKDAQVYVDGYFAGTVDDYDGLFQRLHLNPGEHELIIYKPGFRTVKQTIRVRPRQNSKIQYALQPLPPGETAEAPPPPPKQEEPARQARPPSEAPGQPYEPPGRMPPYREPPPSAGSEAHAFGILALRVQPAGAQVLIDGERWQGPEGEERLTVHLAEGSHRVEIRKEGFVTFETEVAVRGGETTPLNVSLPPRGGMTETERPR